MKVLSKQQSTILTLHHQDIAETNYEKATMLNTIFQPVLILQFLPCQSYIEFGSTCPEDLLCTTLSYIQALDANKTSGPDGISTRMLKNAALSIAPSLAKLFNISIQLGCFPTCWKTSSVVPVPKSSNHKEVCNYRPISLLRASC